MSQRLRYNLNATTEFGLLKDDISAAGREVVLNVQGSASGVVTAPTGGAGTVLTLSVTTLGWLWLRNIDDSAAPNFVTWGVDSAGSLVPVGRLKPGEDAWFRLEPGVTLRLRADALGVPVQYKVLND